MQRTFRMSALIFTLALAVLIFTMPVAAQEYPKPQPEKSKTGSEMKADEGKHKEHTKAAGETSAEKPRPAMAGSGNLTVTLVDPEKKAQGKTATVEVKVTGARIVDPARAKEQPRKGQAHIHYQLDDGPVIATTATKLSFHNLTSGSHKLTVTLAGNDHNPVAAPETLNITIP